MTRRKRRGRPLMVLLLLGLIAVFLYINFAIVPVTGPLFIPTNTPTRSPESYVTAADNLVTQGKLSQAIAAYKEAIQADPRNASNYVTLAKLQVYTNQYAEAVINAENALLLNSNNAMALSIRGWALGLQGNYLDGESAINKAITIDPNSAFHYAVLAHVLALEWSAGTGTLNVQDKAIEASRVAMSMNPNLVESRWSRGLVLEFTQNYEEAVQEFEAAIALNPYVADLHLELGINYRSLDQGEKAIEQFTLANTYNPTDPWPYLYMSRTYAYYGEYAKAIQSAESAVKNAPTDPYMIATLGTMHYYNEQYAQAIDYLRLAIRGGKDESGNVIEGLPLDYGRVASFYYVYGLALAKNSSCGEALQIAQALIQGVPDDEVSADNAQTMIEICQGIADNGTATPSPEPTP